MTEPKKRSGGAREGAGRPSLFAEIPSISDPKEFLLALMSDPDAGIIQRLEAAKILMPYLYRKLDDGGKKEEAAQAAKKAVSGRFAPKKPPKLVVSR